MSKRQQMIEALQSAIDEAEDYGLTMIKVYTQTADEIVDLLAEREHEVSEWLEDSDPGQEYGTTWACWKCRCSIHKPFIWNPYNSGYKYCPHCGSKMVVKQDA